MTPRSRLEDAARLVHEARSIIDSYAGRELGAEERAQVDRLLSAAQKARSQVRRGLRDRDGDVPSSPAARAFHKWLRGQSGRGRRRDFLSPEEKRLVEDATGQILVPEDVTAVILTDLERGVMRPLVGVRPTTSDRLKVRALGPVTMSWRKLETMAPGNNLTAIEDSPLPEGIEVPVKNLTGLAKVGEDELDDSDANLELLIRDVFSSEAADEEDRVFANGTTADEPSGILGDTGVAVVNSEAVGAISADDLLEVQFVIDRRFLRDSVYMADSTVEKSIMLLKDSSGRHIFQFPATPDAPATVLRRPFHANDQMPALNTGAIRAKTLIFGDLERGYRVADRRRVTLKRLEELYAEEGLVGLKFVHRVGGKVIRPRALAILNQ